MKTCSIADTAELARPAIIPVKPQDAAKPNAEPQQQRPDEVERNPRSQSVSATRKPYWWAAALVVVGLLLAGNLAAMLLNRPGVPAVASYNSRVADLDGKLSSELARQLRAAGFSFDAAIVSVESPACEHAVCLLKFLRREVDDGVASGVGGVLVRSSGNGSWSFTGNGDLTTLKFSVDASAEMRRLAEATPPEFPQAAAAIPPNQPPRDNLLGFSVEVETSMTASCETARRHWLDLETGRCLTEPELDYFVNRKALRLDWLRTNNLDLLAAVYHDRSYCYFPRHMTVAPVDGKLWEQATPEEIASHPALRSILNPIRSAASPPKGKIATYIFRTEQGTFGILRVLGLDPSQRQLKLHYKLANVGAKAN